MNCAIDYVTSLAGVHEGLRMFAKKLSVFCTIIAAYDVFIVVIGLRTSSGGLVNENHMERK